MSRLIRQNEVPVFLIVDGHPVHRSRAVLDWVEERNESIRLFFLPGYSPELNPDELLNQDIKSCSVGRRRAKDKAELVKNVRATCGAAREGPRLFRSIAKGNMFDKQPEMLNV